MEEIKRIIPDADFTPYLKELKHILKKAKELDEVLKDEVNDEVLKDPVKDRVKDSVNDEVLKDAVLKDRFSVYGKWSNVIQRVQQLHPSLGNIPLTWYQAAPDGNCFFIAVDAANREDTVAHDVYKNTAKRFRADIVNAMDSLIGQGAAMSFEMNDVLPPSIRLDVAPPTVTYPLLRKYKYHMSRASSWAGQIELTLGARLLKRPIIVFYNNTTRPTIVWHDQRHQTIYKDNKQLRGEPIPLVLGHIPSSASGQGGVHYIYALFRNSAALKKKKKKKKNKKTRRKK